jgi:hypothetical protein
MVKMNLINVMYSGQREVVNISDICAFGVFKKVLLFLEKRQNNLTCIVSGYSRTNQQIYRIGGEHVVAGQYSTPVVIDIGHDSGYLSCI